MSVLNASASPLRLVTALRRSGWGPLAAMWRGVTACLWVLAEHADPRHGGGTMTLAELASRAGYSPRHARRCIGGLVRVGLLAWQPGGVTAGGHRVPSTYTLPKQALYALLAPTRAMWDQALAWRREQAARRVTHLGLRNTLRRKSRSRTEKRLVRAGGHDDPPSLPKGVEGPPAGGADPPARARSIAEAYAAIARAKQRRQGAP